MPFEHAGQYGPESFLFPDGSPPGSSTATVRDSEGELVTLYSDRDRSDTVANPTELDELGNLTLWAEPGAYVLTIDGGHGVATFSIVVPVDPADVSTGAGPTDPTVDIVVPIEPSPVFGTLYLYDLSTELADVYLLRRAPDDATGLIVKMPQPSTVAQQVKVVIAPQVAGVTALGVLNDAGNSLAGSPWSGTQPADFTSRTAVDIVPDGDVADTYTLAVDWGAASDT